MAGAQCDALGTSITVRAASLLEDPPEHPTSKGKRPENQATPKCGDSRVSTSHKAIKAPENRLEKKHVNL